MEFRTASIRLFGHLNKACHGDCEDVFLEQVVGGLVPLLLHLRDPQTSVASVSDHWVRGKGAGLSMISLRPGRNLGTVLRHITGLQVCPVHVRPSPGVC